MPVIRRLTEAIPWLSPAMQQAPLLSATLKEDGEGAEERVGGWRRGTEGLVLVSLFQPSLMRSPPAAPRHCPKITIALF